MRSPDYDANDKQKKWDTKGEIQENYLLLMIERYFSLAKNYSSNRGVLEKNSFKVVPRKKKNAC